MQLDQMWINPRIQNLYAEIIATEDIVSEYGTNCKLISNTQPNQGETNNEIY